MRRGVAVPMASAVVLALLGGASVILGVLPDPSDPAAPSPAAPVPPHPAVTVAPQPTDGDQPISALVDPEWAERVAASAGIPVRAVLSYAGASLAVADSHPDCQLGWNTLAGIGLVESGHGSMGDSELGDDGRATPPIVGIALDGNGVEAVPDSDGGELDGDATWDRAVGPMQFIPSSWTALGLDGDADGVADIHDLDDAALTAAVHLCDVGGDLASRDGWIAAVGAYNPSVDYNHRVAEAAERYAASSR